MIILTACPTDDLNARLKALEDESAKWRGIAQVTAESAIRAVPGERYMRLIDDLNGDDVDKRQKAQNFLKRLGVSDPTIEWEATVYFGFNEAKPLCGDPTGRGMKRKRNLDHIGKARRIGFAPSNSRLPMTQRLGFLPPELIGYLTGYAHPTNTRSLALLGDADASAYELLRNWRCSIPRSATRIRQWSGSKKDMKSASTHRCPVASRLRSARVRQPPKPGAPHWTSTQV